VAFEAVAVIGFKDTQAGVEELACGDDDNVVARGDLVKSERFSNQSFSSVSLNRSAKPSSGRDSQPPSLEGIGPEKHRDQTPPHPRALLEHRLKLGTSTDALVGAKRNYSLLTVRRLRPFARRRFRTSRPFFVLIRTRNPWVPLRRRVFGWNVRFPFMFGSGLHRRALLGLPRGRLMT
jgi:hypothetical protein